MGIASAARPLRIVLNNVQYDNEHNIKFLGTIVHVFHSLYIFVSNMGILNLLLKKVF